jgi:N-acetylglucosaminyldiphosphoundecaprenol N-acetyl-beta-D-mannosaminyltransferase
MQQLGLEWVWRLSMEPRRLWKRYLLQDTMFFRLLWNEYFVQRRRRAARSMP